ncbi:MAG: cytochrome c-type biogenesis protein CcmH [Polaromonas sp.]|nr:cytochrome c-type biogenesis protein CcmH [Polaromonas sp.]
MLACLALAAPLLSMPPAAAQTPAPSVPTSRAAPSSYADPALEARVLAVAEELRCLVCQNETIAASHADLAVDLRNQIRIKLRQGQSQEQILDFMAERYGDFVLYRPRLKASTVLLWAGPFVLLGFAVWVLIRNIRRQHRALVPAELSQEENARVAALLAEVARPTPGSPS